MLKYILLGLVVVIGIFLIVVALQPADFKIWRSTVIAAPPATVFAQVNDFHNWNEWSPWAKLDPAAKNIFEGPAAGVNAMFSWSGNDKVGEGRMTIIESHPDDLIRIKLDFVKPFPSTATAEYTFKSEGAQTAVTWAMSGHNSFVSKAFCLFVNMDKMVGGDFERGLAQLKTVSEAAAKEKPASPAKPLP